MSDANIQPLQSLRLLGGVKKKNLFYILARITEEKEGRAGRPEIP